MPDPLPPDFHDAFQASAARRGGFGDPAYYFTEIGSTNDVAASLADAGATEGTIVFASSQTAGRGRLGRVWYSPLGAGLYVSVVCRNRIAAPYLTLAGGLAVAEGIVRATGLPAEIKWPNDVGCRSGQPARFRKLAGILAEATSTTGGIQHVILGFGINVRSTAYPSELTDRATSIESELGRPVEPALLLVETLASLGEHYRHLARGDSGVLIDSWRQRAPSAIGSAVEFPTAAGRVAGISAGIDDDGALLVNVGDRVERVISGEVIWR